MWDVKKSLLGLPEVKTPEVKFPVQGAQVRSLVREQRFNTPHGALAKKKVNKSDKHQLSQVIKANINSGFKSYWQCVPLTQWHFISVVILLKTHNPSLIAKKSIREILNPSWGIKCVWSDMFSLYLTILLKSKEEPKKRWQVNCMWFRPWDLRAEKEGIG